MLMRVPSKAGQFLPTTSWSIMVAVMMLAVLSVPRVAYAAPSLSDCRSLAKVCVEPDQTRKIGQFMVHAACWKWKDTYDCARPRPHRSDCSYLKRRSYCSKTGRTCIQTKDGVCERYQVRWHCTAKPSYAGRARLTSERYRIRSEKLVSSCTAQENRQDCRRTNQTCVSGAATRNIKGMRIDRDCWRYERSYECLGTDMQDDCGPLDQDTTCRLTQSDCLSNAPNGSCAHEERVYSCGADTDGEINQNCTSAAWCVDGDCTDVARQPANRSFGRAASAMNLLQEMGKDFAFDGDSLSIFKGEKMSCSKWILGLKNCCKVGGLLLRADLANCSANEKKLATKRAARVTWHVRSYCKSKTFFGLCTVKAEDHCTFKSRLGRMLQEQARGQLGVGRDNCRGLSVAEIERVDWGQIDLTEILGDIQSKLQPMEAGQIKQQMKGRIQTFYKRIKTGRVKTGRIKTNTPDNSTGDR